MEDEVSTTNEEGIVMNYYSEKDYKDAIFASSGIGFIIGVVSMLILIVIVWF